MKQLLGESTAGAEGVARPYLPIEGEAGTKVVGRYAGSRRAAPRNQRPVRPPDHSVREACSEIVARDAGVVRVVPDQPQDPVIAVDPQVRGGSGRLGAVVPQVADGLGVHHRGSVGVGRDGGSARCGRDHAERSVRVPRGEGWGCKQPHGGGAHQHGGSWNAKLCAHHVDPRLAGAVAASRPPILGIVGALQRSALTERWTNGQGT